MCGLVGYYGVTGETDMTAFRNLMLLNQIRGMHSTGVYARYSSEGAEQLARSVGGVEKWSMSKEAKRIASSKSLKILPIVKFVDDNLKKTEKIYPDVLLGHGRFATVGDVTKKNAHPFEFDRIVGMHNGTMCSTWLSKAGWKEDVTDSQFCLGLINDAAHDIDKLKETLTSFRGEFCFIWYDKVMDKLSFFRNRHRPLFARVSKLESKVAFASERWYLDTALGKAGLEHSFQEAVMLPTYKYVSMTWDFDKSCLAGADMIDIDPPPLPSPSGYGGLGAYGMYAGPKGVAHNVHHIPDYQYNHTSNAVVRKRVGASVHRYVTREEFDKMTPEGCVCCNIDLPFERAENIWWFDNDTPVCQSCREEFFGDTAVAK